MTSRVTFTASSTGNYTTLAGPAVAFILPAVDSNNTDTMITNSGTDAVFVSFGAGVAVGLQASGCVKVDGGQTLLLTTKTGITTGSVSGQIVSGNIATNAAQTTIVNLVSGMPSQPVTIQRGTAIIAATF
ncbi:MAG: hypothetical protein KGH75_09735 [Rhodospirillales bacterium]|nr:hypothetical protein [Rhodospirillales bacterium]